VTVYPPDERNATQDIADVDSSVARQCCFLWTLIFIAAKELLKRYLHPEAGLHIG
jgi:hypothetical protein